MEEFTTLMGWVVEAYDTESRLVNEMTNVTRHGLEKFMMRTALADGATYWKITEVRELALPGGSEDE